MRGRLGLLMLAVCVSSSVGSLPPSDSCEPGFRKQGTCIDNDECAVDEDYPDDVGPCGMNTVCFNTIGSFYCQCEDGFMSSTQAVNFTAEISVTCKDINECVDKDICGPNAVCNNTMAGYLCFCKGGFLTSTGVENFRQGENVTCRDVNECEGEKPCVSNEVCVNVPGSYQCDCNPGFGRKSGNMSSTGSHVECEAICMIDKTICGNGTCHVGASGHYCACYAGSTNYGNQESRCTALNCDAFRDVINLREMFSGALAPDVLMQLKNSCLDLVESETPAGLDGDDLLERLLDLMDGLLSSGASKDNRRVSTFLNVVESALRLIGPFTTPSRTQKSTATTDLELLLHKGAVLPQGPVTLSSEQARLDIHLETAAGDPSHYPGFTTVSLMSYKNLELSTDGFFSGMKTEEDQSFKINSKVVTVTVSNTHTSQLKEPVILTFKHLEQSTHNHTCVYWDSTVYGGMWSDEGCWVVKSDPEYTVCFCNHLSTFAVLMALYDVKDTFQLQLITWVGLSLSLLCLFICILTFSLIQSIKSPRTTIHLHLCISLFIANLIFLAGISRTDNQLGCAVVAGLLHFFYLAAFCWMCLEGVQLFRMVVLVFNTNFKSLYMLAGGYGVPAVIVAISASVKAKGYGTKRYCWLNLEDHLIWSFFGPACFVIIINIFFFLITVWKLAQKFSSLNPDLNNLRKIRAFVITAVAQLCVLGTMWIFGCFQFKPGNLPMTYLFTIFGSFQGVLLFVMHCLFSKQVRDEYGNFLSRCCAPQKKHYSEMTSSNSKAQGSKSTQDTGESHI
ncbi:adhesion G protein-coupled receptor E5 [Genypterus blacodes]|uniref:adhesion G protein-coupled receptor E5 n=1 Tax=Genypterus blacodes TaxID=154954 RepID=UPI003F763F76